jgi:hypothetical protein
MYLCTFSFNVKNTDPILGKDTTLQVNTGGHIIHAFVNGRHVGNYHLNFSNS